MDHDVYENVALVGATGAVGRIVRDLLESRKFPYKTIRFLATKRSAGTTIRFAGKDHVVEELTPDAFAGVDLVIASTPDEAAAEFVPWAVKAGAVVIDESAHHRMLRGVPLVVPEVNPEAAFSHNGVIASPNCSVTQLVVALKPLHDAARVRRVIVSTYQAASGAGLAAEQELTDATRAHLDGTAHTPTQFVHPLAMNLIPQIGSARDNGYTSEEMKMVHETQKIFDDMHMKVSPTCVRVPVANCHSESVLVETEKKLTVEQVRELFRNAPGITLVDDLPCKQYPMPRNCTGCDDVFVGRIRQDLSYDNGIAFWCVSDNLRKGAATNAVQIAELLIGTMVDA